MYKIGDLITYRFCNKVYMERIEQIAKKGYLVSNNKMSFFVRNEEVIGKVE